MVDLHMHSRYSDDGEFTPVSLVDQCWEQGIRIMSVTDHNCQAANQEARAAAEERGIRFLTGVEIDCVYEDTNFHVLGYGFDVGNRDFQLLEENIRGQSSQASLKLLAATQALGFHVTESDMRAVSRDSYWQGAWTGEMFAEVLLAKAEYADHPLLSPYRPGGLRSDNPYVNFYWDFYSQGKPCYVEIAFPPMTEVIGMIHANHGIAVLAHPGVNLKGKEFLLNKLLDLELDGLEAYSSYHTSEQAAGFCQKASERQILITCGSDFHGKTKPSVKLGGHGCPLSDQQMDKFLNRALPS